MERSKIALHKWLQAFYIVTSSKRRVSAYHLHRTLDIGYESAWFMHYRIREAMRGGGLSFGTAVRCTGGTAEPAQSTLAPGSTRLHLHGRRRSRGEAKA
jgi:hypothetical protein